MLKIAWDRVSNITGTTLTIITARCQMETRFYFRKLCIWTSYSQRVHLPLVFTPPSHYSPRYIHTIVPKGSRPSVQAKHHQNDSCRMQHDFASVCHFGQLYIKTCALVLHVGSSVHSSYWLN